MPQHDAAINRRRRRRLIAYVCGVATLAVALFFALVSTSATVLPQSNSFAIAIFSTMLFLGETRPKLWMRFGDEGEVTPGWAFAYAIVLLGSPVVAISVMVLSNLFVDVRNERGALKIVFNVSQVTVSLCSGGLVLHAFGVDEGISGLDRLPPSVGIAMIAGGLAIFVINCSLTGTVICLHLGITPVELAHASFALTMGVDGALLALAPVFVIAVQYSLLMLPLLVVTSFLVFHSARTAMQREHEANHDPLTMLLNRRAFDERLSTALEGIDDDNHTLVLVMDLDRFKDINDRLGHLVGDRLLRSFAERLERALPATASASRLGGDEFAAVIPRLGTNAEARRLVERLHTQLSGPHDLSGFPLSAAVSLGAALSPIGGKSPSSMMAAADLAMYRAKQYGTGVEFAAESDNPHDIGRVGLLTDLRTAIGTSQISAHYQPLVRLADGRIESVEALVRWHHPEYGSIAPIDFIAMTEQTDLIGPLTETMLRMAMADLLTFGADMPKLCVNIAARSLHDRQFAANVIGVVEELAFPPGQLEIEVTERDIATNSERSALSLARLRAAGIRIAIDDFGTGYSSFLTLRDLKADRLKIDQQFTTNLVASPADQLIVTKVIEIAHSLGLDVVAEGVESDEVWQRLGELGCDVAQGYAIARPMAIDPLRVWISHNRAIANATAAPLGRAVIPATIPAAMYPDQHDLVPLRPRVPIDPPSYDLIHTPMRSLRPQLLTP